MAKSYLDKDGVLYLWQKIKTYFTGTSTPLMDGTAATGSSTKLAREDHVHPSDTTKVDKVSGKGLSTNDYTTAEKNKLAGIATGAEVNQNTFSTVKVGTTLVAADAKTDTLELVAGTNITLTPDATNDKVTIATAAEVNQNAFSNVKFGSYTVAANSKTDTLELVAGTNIAITPGTNDKVTITAATVTLPNLGCGYAECTNDGLNRTCSVINTVTQATYTLVTGGMVAVKFTYAITNSATTLNIDSTGAKPMKFSTDTGYLLNIKAGDIVTFVYDGTNYQVVSVNRFSGDLNPYTELSEIDPDHPSDPLEVIDQGLELNGKYLSFTDVGVATASVPGLMSADDKEKLDGINTGAQVNQNAFSNVKVGSTTVVADSWTDTLELVAGTNITLTPDAPNDKITIAAAAGITSNVQLGQGIGTCSTALATQAKVVTLSNYEKKTGGIVAVKFTNGARFGSQAMTLNINSTGASTVYFGGQTTTSGSVIAPIANSNGVAIFMYDGTNYQLIGSDLAYPPQLNLASTTSPGYMSNTDKTKLDKAITTDNKGAAQGYCPLDDSRKVPSQYLPSYVDDVIEAYARSGETALSSTWLATGSASGTVITPEVGKIYILMADSGDYAANTQFRWSGSSYVKMADGGVSAITNAEIDTIIAS